MTNLAHTDSDRAEMLLPWLGGGRLITVLVMREYLAPRLVRATADLCAAMFALIGELTPEKRVGLKESVSSFVEETAALGLALTHKAAKGLAEAVKTETTEELERRMGDVQSRFDDEAENLTLFYLHADALKFYNKTDLFGEAFKTNFPTANAEIIEAGNCFAFDRFTACAFHLMRSLEVVLKVLFTTLGLPSITTSGAQNWNGILREIKTKLETDKTIPDHDFYDGAYAFLAAAKNPMRNATMHVDVSYDEDSARPLFDAVGAFMRHIATKLQESP